MTIKNKISVCVLIHQVRKQDHITTLLGILLLTGVFFITDLRAQNSCLIKLQEAEKKYELGFFKQVIDSLKDCKRSDFAAETGLTQAREHFIRSRELLAVSYIATDQPELVRKLVREILDAKVDYISDASVQPSLFNKSVNELKPQKKKWYKNKWFVIAGSGAVAVGTAAAFGLILSKDEKADQLPGPPALPNR